MFVENVVCQNPKIVRILFTVMRLKHKHTLGLAYRISFVISFLSQHEKIESKSVLYLVILMAYAILT